MADNNNVNIKALKVIDLVCIFSFRIYNNFISMERERGRERTNFKIIDSSLPINGQIVSLRWSAQNGTVINIGHFNILLAMAVYLS